MIDKEYTTNDEVLHIRGLPARAEAMAIRNGMTASEYIDRYGEAMKKRVDWREINPAVAFYEFNKVLGAIKKRKVA